MLIGLGEEGFDALDGEVWHVAIEDQCPGASIAELLSRLPHRMPRAELLGLHGGRELVGVRSREQVRLDLLAVMSEDHRHARCACSERGVHDAIEQGSTEDLVEDLDRLRAHACAFACCEYDCLEAHG